MITTLPRVAIIIVTYNSEHFIIKCLHSIQKNNYKYKKIIIIDNNSSDKTIAVIKKEFPQVTIIENDNNLGFAAANNIAVRFISKKFNPKYIMLLNPDTCIKSDFIKSAVTALEKNRKIGILGSIITYSNQPKKIWFAGGIVNKIFGYTRHLLMNKNVIEDKLNHRISLKHTDFVTGAGMVIRNEIFAKIGYLSEDYFMYFEDVEFCQRALRAGYDCVFINHPYICHDVSASTGKIGTNDLTKFKAYYFARNPFLYIKSNVSGWRRYTNYLGQFIIRLPYYFLKITMQKNIPALFSYTRGIIDGIKYKQESKNNYEL